MNTTLHEIFGEKIETINRALVEQNVDIEFMKTMDKYLLASKLADKYDLLDDFESKIVRSPYFEKAIKNDSMMVSQNPKKKLIYACHFVGKFDQDEDEEALDIYEKREDEDEDEGEEDDYQLNEEDFTSTQEKRDLISKLEEDTRNYKKYFELMDLEEQEYFYHLTSQHNEVFEEIEQLSGNAKKAYYYLIETEKDKDKGRNFGIPHRYLLEIGRRINDENVIGSKPVWKSK